MDTQVTLVVMTPEKALMFQELLTSKGISCELESVMNNKLRVGLRIKVNLNDLPAAMRVLESNVSFLRGRNNAKSSGMGKKLLIPVDFSESSLLACKVGFQLAARLGIEVALLHAYSSPLFLAPKKGEKNDRLRDGVVHARTYREDAESGMTLLEEKLRSFISDGVWPDVDFSCEIKEGLPEETIIEWAKINEPALIVMATRGKDRKEEELIGSVTAEVLDSCRVPIFTVPENRVIPAVEDIENLVLFCNVDRQDLLAIDGLMRMFDSPDVNISLIPVDDKLSYRRREKLEGLRKYFEETYANGCFRSMVLEKDTFREDLENIIVSEDIHLLIIPNKKTHVFSRIFKPTMAHRFLFERDMPMLIIPV